MTDQPSEDQEPQVRPFAAFLQETNKGRTHSELSDRLHELIGAVVETGRKGTLTLQVTVEHTKNAADNQLSVTEQVKLALPKPDVRTSIFFADSEGNLTRTDPDQMSFGDLKVAGHTERQAQ